MTDAIIDAKERINARAGIGSAMREGFNEPRYHAWCLTINNPKADGTEHPVFALDENWCCPLYWVCGEEVSESGTPHYQVYVYFVVPHLFQKVKKIFPRSHIERAEHSPHRCVKYCKKDGKWTEGGSYEDMISHYLTF